MATRRSPPPSPAHADLSVDQMRRGIARLERSIDDVHAFDFARATTRWGYEQKAVEAAVEGTLASVFGHGTIEYLRYSDATSLDGEPATISFGLGNSSAAQEAHETQESLKAGVERATLLLRQAIRWLQDEIADSVADSVPKPNAQLSTAQPAPKPRKVFVVHGHDEGALQSVARFIEKIHFEAIILREQPNQGRTIIEKIEANKDVGFAVVLLTPDDEGGKSGETPRPRARQNVLLELGYFIGSLGRPNVCALASPGPIELPTDFAGVVWESLDSNGAWKQALARELKAAGFAIDWNDVMS